jgi:DNA gyrase inhibitor GyrI
MTPRLVTLEPMRIASAWAFGASPERLAYDKLKAWAEPQGLFDGSRRIFGFNNPNPSAGSPNYGYEFWIEVGPEIEPSGDIRITHVSGGLYAMAPFAQPDSDYGETLPPAWGQLDAWVAANNHRHGPHQWLEQHSPAGKVQALYYPVMA